MKALLPLLFLLAVPAFGQEAVWRIENGGAVAEPFESNSNIVRVEISCDGDPYRFAVYSEHGPVLPADGQGEADYFYEPGRIEAEIDGSAFPLTAAGSDDAVVLFGQGTAEEGHLADLDEAFIASLQEGTTLTLAFDIAPAPNAETDSPFETFARFSLQGAGEAIGRVMTSCTP